MIDLEDFVIKKIGRQGRQDKFYKIYCNRCGADRGYLLKTSDKRPSCNKCSKVGVKLSIKTKQKMSAAAFGNKNACKDYISNKKSQIDRRSIRDICTYKTSTKLLTEEHKKIRHNIKNLINQKLKNRGLSKKCKTFLALGYTVEDLKFHLESKFQPGMSWDNYGIKGWHIDHVVPDSWFKYNSMTDDQFKQSWSLENLQPLWAHENQSKGNRYSSKVNE